MKSRSTTKTPLTPIQEQVVKHNATEPPFQNEYWDTYEPGIYVDVVSGEPLFSSLDKYDAGTGWPSFHKPVNPPEISEHLDESHGMIRTEVRGESGDTHLGHVFRSGPKDQKQYYCINSAALRFVPVANLKEEGYEEYLKLFKDSEKQ